MISASLTARLISQSLVFIPVLQVNCFVLPLNHTMCDLFCRFHVDKMSSAHVYLRLRKVSSWMYSENVDQCLLCLDCNYF